MTTDEEQKKRNQGPKNTLHDVTLYYNDTFITGVEC